jgi:WD40 repeat protein
MLSSSEITKDSVTSIDVNSGMTYLLAGHKSGNISFWSLKSLTLLRQQIKKHRSQVVGIRFLESAEEA